MSPLKQELLNTIANAPDDAIGETLQFLKTVLKRSTETEQSQKYIVEIHYNAIESSNPHHYPLRGMPLTISDDFDEAMPELWDAFGE